MCQDQECKLKEIEHLKNENQNFECLSQEQQSKIKEMNQQILDLKEEVDDLKYSNE